MGTAGSATRRTTLPATLAVVSFLMGVAAMMLAGMATISHGLRAALTWSEVALAAPGVLALVAFGMSLRLALALEPLGPRQTAFAIGCGGALWAASLGLFEVQYAFWAPPAGYLEGFRRLHEALAPKGPLDAVLSLIAIAILPAVCEEVLLRGILQPALAKRIGAFAAVLLSACLFGLIHYDPQFRTFYRVPFATAVGLGLGVLRVRAGALTPCILAHALLNTTTFVLAPYTDDPTGAPEQASVLQGLAMLIVGGAVSVLLLRRFPRGTDRT
jgi:membrane protease YdiL (CAAX protease family)